MPLSRVDPFRRPPDGDGGPDGIGGFETAFFGRFAFRNGLYPLCPVPNESYLRGVPVTDANGQVTSTTIYPACYSGRWPHMHFAVFATVANALRGRHAILTSNRAQVSLSNDTVVGDNRTAQIAQQAPTVTGSNGAGYVATALVGVAPECPEMAWAQPWRRPRRPDPFARAGRRTLSFDPARIGG